MIIRKATLSDLEALMLMIGKVVAAMLATGNTQWNNDYPNTTIFNQDIAREQLWVADVEGVVAGVLAVTTEKEPEYAGVPGWNTTEPAVVLHRLAVSPDYQGWGIAAALLKQAEAEAIRMQFPRLFLDTNSINRPMQNLSVKLGYHLAGEINLHRRPGLRFMCYEKRVSVSE